uniref:Uncharacterized protein n=1 Tax=Panagrolaimus sp. ES5 TaxID=591445 RepID=A0AC34FWD0_9BILA
MDRIKPKKIELLAFDKKENLQYQGCCKLQIAVLSKLLIVEPSDE